MASEKHARILFADDHFVISDFNLYLNYADITITDKEENVEKEYKLDLPGIYQTKNLITTLESVEILKQNHRLLHEQRVSCALKQVRKLTGFHGRWDVIHEHPTVILEVAHNEDGILQMLSHLQHLQYSQLHLIFGIVKDKDVKKILQLLSYDARYYFTQAPIPRALPATVLWQKATEIGLEGKVFDNVNDALHQAKKSASKDDIIIVCGSIFLVAEVDKRTFQ
ncbi:MAG: hypothetical protein ICV66_08000 [Chitinophagaceae bacterium]|nr:hypothetical protein [Chitinophagaceae bacterium]